MLKTFTSVLAAVLLASIGSVSVVRAASVTYGFTGSVYLVSDSISSAIAVGDAVSGSFTFDDTVVGQTSSPGGVLDPSITYYPWILTAFDVRIGSYSASLGSVGEQRIFVINDDASGRDRFLVELFPPTGASVGGLSPYGLALNFQDNSGDVLQDGSIPLDASTLNKFLNRAGTLDFVAGDARNRAEFSISEVHSVPTPASGSLLAVGLIALLISRRASERQTAMR